jgi:hypothetical protein
MKNAIAAAAAVAALVLAPAALAANTGTMWVSHAPLVLAGSKSTTIHVNLPQTDDPIAAINIYVPNSYTLTLNQAAGTTIGNVSATVFSHTQGLSLPLTGTVVAQAPSNFTTQSTQCTGSPTSQAVWLLDMTVAGQSIQLPLYVNATQGVEQTLGLEKLTVCLPPWDIPESLGGAAQGAQILDVLFTVNGVFTTPTAGGLSRWDALVTPYTPGTGKANPAGTFEMRAFVPLPVVLGLHATYLPKTNTFRLSGKVTEGGLPVPSLTLHIARGVSPSRLTQRSTTRTDANGNWKTAGHLSPRRTTYFQLNASVGEKESTYAAGCQSPATAVAPAGCVSATLSPWSMKSSVYTLKVSKAFKRSHRKK